MIKMIKTIERALCEHIRSMQEGGCIPNHEEDDFNAGVLYGFKQGFNNGVEFAQRWISVDDELPEAACQVLIKNAAGDISTAMYSKDKFIIDFSEISDKKVTHWRYLELKSE
jgi:hypothetical protein